MQIKLWGLILILGCFLSACAGQKPVGETGLQAYAAHSQAYASDSLTRVGEINRDELLERYPKFTEHYQRFEPSAQELNEIQVLQDSEILVFLGLWCHDSQREVSRFLKLIDQSKINYKSLKLVSVDRYKTLPKEYQSQFKLHKTPTFFVLKDGNLVATLVEKPEQTLSGDLARQLVF